MTTVPVLAPQLDLPPDEPARVSCWLVRRGAMVLEGDRLVELLLGEMTFDVPSPASGRLVETVARPRQSVAPGDCLGAIQIDAEPAPRWRPRVS